MRANQTILVAIALILLASAAGCQSDKLSVDSLLPKPKVHVDPSTKKECEGVVDIPHRFIPSSEQAQLHAEDRRRLGDCKRLNHAKAVTIQALTR